MKIPVWQFAREDADRRLAIMPLVVSDHSVGHDRPENGTRDCHSEDPADDLPRRPNESYLAHAIGGTTF
jgi:hypothetical protein